MENTESKKGCTTQKSKCVFFGPKAAFFQKDLKGKCHQITVLGNIHIQERFVKAYVYFV